MKPFPTGLYQYAFLVVSLQTRTEFKHTKTGNASSDNELRETVRGTLDDLADCPKCNTEKECPSAAERVADDDAKEGRNQTSKVP